MEEVDITHDDNKVIHLYILDECTHHCKYCCNKQYDTMKIPVVTVEELQHAEVVCLTGGEPFLCDCVCDFAAGIKRQYPNVKKIFVYTCGDSLLSWLRKGYKIHGIDGVNLSPKNKYDVECVQTIFNTPSYRAQVMDLWSNRIYKMPEVSDYMYDTLVLNTYENFDVTYREWQKEFIPNGGIFRRLPILFKGEK